MPSYLLIYYKTPFVETEISCFFVLSYRIVIKSCSLFLIIEIVIYNNYKYVLYTRKHFTPPFLIHITRTLFQMVVLLSKTCFKCQKLVNKNKIESKIYNVLSYRIVIKSRSLFLMLEIIIHNNHYYIIFLKEKYQGKAT